jgi:hypothetical protein
LLNSINKQNLIFKQNILIQQNDFDHNKLVDFVFDDESRARSTTNPSSAPNAYNPHLQAGLH